MLPNSLTTIKVHFHPLNVICILHGISLLNYFYRSKIHRIICNVYSGILAIVCLIVSLYRLLYVAPRFSQSNAVAHSVLGIQQILNTIVILMIYYQVFSYKFDIRNVFQLISAIDREFLKLNIRFAYKSFGRKILFEVVFIVCFIYGSFVFFSVYYEVDDGNSLLLELFSFVIPILLVNLTLLTFVNFGWCINVKFKKLKLFLVDLCAIDSIVANDEIWKVKLIRETPRVFFVELKKIAEIYELLYEAVNRLNYVFGLSNLSSMGKLVGVLKKIIYHF